MNSDLAFSATDILTENGDFKITITDGRNIWDTLYADYGDWILNPLSASRLNKVIGTTGITNISDLTTPIVEDGFTLSQINEYVKLLINSKQL